MKKLLYTFLAASIIFAACKKEDDITTGSSTGISSNNSGCTDTMATNYNPAATVDDGTCIYNTSASILGTWNLIQYATTFSEGYYTNYPNGKVTTWDTSVNYTLPDTGLAESITWEFFNNGTMEEMMDFGSGDNDTDYYTWTKNGNTLALDTDWVVTINTLTANNLNWTDDSEDTSSYYDYYNPSTGYWEYGYGDTVYFDRFIGTASWNRISGLSPNTSNARLKQNNIKESPFSSRFINRRKK